MTPAEFIVVGLAKSDPVVHVDKHKMMCVHCYATAEYFDPAPPFPHESRCLWLAAQTYVGAFNP